MDFKKLTAQEVASKRFTPVRMREGYAIHEVDEFLETVENTLISHSEAQSELERINAELRNAPPSGASQEELDRYAAELANKDRQLNQLASERDEFKNRALMVEQTVEQLGRQLVEARHQLETAVNAKDAAEAAAANALELAHNAKEIADKPLDIAGASGAVARMLETAAKNYDELVAQGEHEAKLVKDHASEEANLLISQAQAEANKAIAEAEAMRGEAFSQIEHEKRELETAVTKLKSIEQKLREDLIALYSSGLEEVKKPRVGFEEGPPAAAPKVGSRRSSMQEAGLSPSFSEVPSFNS